MSIFTRIVLFCIASASLATALAWMINSTSDSPVGKLVRCILESFCEAVTANAIVLLVYWCIKDALGR